MEQPFFSYHPSGGGSPLDQGGGPERAAWTSALGRTAAASSGNSAFLDAAAAPSAGRCRRGRTQPPSAPRARLCGKQGCSTLGQLAHRRLFQRQARPQAARRFGRPRPISRLSRTGRPHRTCCRHGCSPGPEAASSTRSGSVAPGGGLGRRRCSACAVYAQRRGSGVGSVYAAYRQRIGMPLQLM